MAIRSIKGWLFCSCWCLVLLLSLLLALVVSSPLATIGYGVLCMLALANGWITLLRLGVVGPRC